MEEFAFYPTLKCQMHFPQPQYMPIITSAPFVASEAELCFSL